jgi:hypothetical protein
MHKKKRKGRAMNEKQRIIKIMRSSSKKELAERLYELQHHAELLKHNAIQTLIARYDLKEAEPTKEDIAVLMEQNKRMREELEKAQELPTRIKDRPRIFITKQPFNCIETAKIRCKPREVGQTLKQMKEQGWDTQDPIAYYEDGEITIKLYRDASETIKELIEAGEAIEHEE